MNKISIHIDYSKDKQKFKSLFDSYYTPLCFFANKYLQNMSVSKDLVQEIFVNIWEGKIIIKSEQSLKSFLYTITKNNCIDYIKLKIKEKSQISETIESLSDDIAERYMLEEEIYNNIHLAIKNLSNKAQEIIILSIGGLSNPDISKELNISINTVKTIKKRAYEKLRNDLKKSNITNKSLIILYGVLYNLE